jgi:hypothetical protein
MYDNASIRELVHRVGFEVLERNDTPSRAFRENDGSVHVVARRAA